MTMELKKVLAGGKNNVRVDKSVEIIYGQDQAFVNHPVVFPTVGMGLSVCDDLWRIADEIAVSQRHESIMHSDGDGWYSFYFGLNGYNKSHVDGHIDVIVDYYGNESDGACITIDLDEQEQEMMFKIIDESLKEQYGRGAMDFLKEAEEKMHD